MANKIRVLRVVPSLEFGGVESRVLIQSKLLDRSKFDLVVCSLSGLGSIGRKITATGTEVVALNSSPTVRNIRLVRELSTILEKYRPDIIHASISEGIFFAALAKGLSKVDGSLILEEVGIPNRARIGRAVFGSLFGTADVVVGVSQATCRYLEWEGAPKDKTRLIYNCADQKFFDTAVPQQAGQDTVTFLMIGRLVHVKNQATVVKAFSKALLSVENIELKIIGEGPLKPELEQLIMELDLGEYVRMEGFRTDIADQIKTGDVFLLPSFSEGCSISLIEAMAMGLVPVGAAIDGIKEVMGGLSSLLVPPTDIDGWSSMIVSLARMKKSQRFEIGEEAQAIAFRSFSPTRYIANLESLYLELRE